MTIKIDKKIVEYAVNPEHDVSTDSNESPADNVIQMHEKLERPEMLLGSTYKVKTPLSEHALYVTINDVVLNQGTEQEIKEQRQELNRLERRYAQKEEQLERILT